MNVVAEEILACRADRIIDLRNRLALAIDPRVRKELEAEIDAERRDLALLFSEERRRDGFYARRDEHGTLSLHLGRLALPVNSAYLEHLAGELKIAVPAKGAVVATAAIAIDAIEEALAQVDHDIAASGDLRRRLAFFHRVAESLASKGEDEKACA